MKNEVLDIRILYGFNVFFIDHGSDSLFKKKECVGFLSFMVRFYFDCLDFLSSYHDTFRAKFMMKYLRFFKEREWNLVAIAFFCVAMVLGFFIEFFENQIPCVLCFLQRIIMMGIAFSLYLNLLNGIRPRYYGFALIWSLLGITCALRHIAINVCKEVPIGAYSFGPYRLYTWSFLIFFFSILGIAVLLCVDKKTHVFPIKPKKDFLVYTAATLLLTMLTIGLFSVIQKHGWGF